MGTKIRLKTTPLERLRTTPQNFEFAQAVRLLEQSYHYNDKTSSNDFHGASLPSIGSKTLPHQERIRLRQKVSLSFPAADLDKLIVQETEQGIKQAILDVSFLGLVGVSGALPTYFTELVIERTRLGDQTLKDFLDIFHHRILSFFYRAEVKYRFLLRFENGVQKGEKEDSNVTPLQSLHGNGISGTNIESLIPADMGVFYAGLLAQKPRSALNLERLLSSYLSHPVYVEQFKGNWLVLRQSDWTKTSAKCKEGAHNKLGKGALLGKKVWSVDNKFTLTIGPLSLHQFNEFLPESSHLTQTKKIINYYINNDLNCEIKLILKAKEVPFCQIKYKNSPQLGWNTWLLKKMSLIDRDDTLLKG